ncbi:MAG: glycosyltransferase family 1 protein [Candidatus Omnitrophota bacterium]|nr:glycosyltransferase family 1 protein [Candidatus Omnitrophota bacterium]
MDKKNCTIGILSVNPPGQVGSMARYERMLSEACETNRNVYKIETVCLALPSRVLSKFPAKARNIIHHLWIMLMGQAKLSFYKDVDIFHVVDGSYAYVADHIRQKPVVITAHDIIPYLQKEGVLVTPTKPSWFSGHIIERSRRVLKKAHMIISDTKKTKNDLVAYAHLDPARIKVVCPALPQRFNDIVSKGDMETWQEKRNSDEAYILTVGNNAFYKNRPGILNIYKKVREKINIRLVIAGEGPDKELLGAVKKMDLIDAVIFEIDPNDDALVELYKNACLFLFPSMYEGFGWPPLEAMACGCPVVCSDAASLPEVVGTAALTAPYDDIDAMFYHCCKILDDQFLAEDLIVRGFEQSKKFSLEKMTEGILDVYSSVLENAAGRNVGDLL